MCLIILIFFRVKEDYYGQKLNGPNLNKLLKNTAELTAFLPESLDKFGQTLQKLDQMKKSCFSMDLDCNWEEHHKLFIEAFLDLGIPRFPKFHITEIHVPEIIKTKGVGLKLFLFFHLPTNNAEIGAFLSPLSFGTTVWRFR